MSTRCHIAVYQTNDTSLDNYTALLYRHSDGYPGTEDGADYGVLADITPFIRDFISKRGYDDEYLAARLMQHLTNISDANNDAFRKEMGMDADPHVYGYGICNQFHGDHEYHYAIHPNRVDVYECGYDEKPFQWKKIDSIPLVEVAVK